MLRSGVVSTKSNALIQEHGDKVISDDFLEAEIDRLQRAIMNWAVGHDLWHDCGFHSFLNHVDAEPSQEPVITILSCEGDLNSVLYSTTDEELYEEFETLLKRMGYWFEFYDTVSIHIYCDRPQLKRKFADYFYWQWICSLVRPDFDDIYEELYLYFGNRPEELLRLEWRQFEILLSRILHNQGYEAQLGPGTGDGGIDIRLVQRDPIGDILTCVQAKRYRPDRKIDLQAVQALHGASVAENAESSFFVTTSDYFPSAKRFAARKNVPMKLYATSDVQDWCRQAGRGIIADKTTLMSESSVVRCLAEASDDPKRRVLHAQSHLRGITNSFALILKETKNAALLMSLPRKTLSHDGYGQKGVEVPDVSLSALSEFRSKRVWRVKKKTYDERTRYWDGQRLFAAWTELPTEFDYCD